MQSVQSLEPRRMMAVDLNIGFALNGGQPLITSSATDLQVTFSVRNSGSTATTAAVTSELFISADRKFDRRDVRIASASTAAGLVGRTASTRRAGLVLPTAAPGRYFLIAIVDRAGAAGRDANTADNAVAVRRPALTLVPTFETVREGGNDIYVVQGTERSDKVGIIFSGDQLVVGVNGTLRAVASKNVPVLGAILLGGNDRLACNTDVTTPLAVLGGTGNDRISGTAATDILGGEDGSDIIFGGGGNDLISGGNGNDRIFGGAGADTLAGEAGNDRFFGNLGDGSIDSIAGGDGADQYDGKDAGDILDAVETLI